MSVDIDKIRLDGGTQSRAAINEATVAEYAEAMADENTVFPPIIVYFDGADYWLADGFHRIAAWARIGRTEIPAEVRQGDRRRAILHSVAANSAHGLRRTNDDKRRAVLTLLEDAEWSQWSDREIARQCAVTHPFVAKIRRELSGEGGNGYHPETDAKADTGPGEGKPAPAQPAQPVGVEYLASETPEAQRHPPQEVAPEPSRPDEDPTTAKVRRELAKLTRQALEDEVIGLRADLADERSKRRAAEKRADDLKEQVNLLTADDDMGRKLGLAIDRERQAKGRLAETQAQLARETRRANGFEAQCKKLRAELENQEIPL